MEKGLVFILHGKLFFFPLVVNQLAAPHKFMFLEVGMLFQLV